MNWKKSALPKVATITRLQFDSILGPCQCGQSGCKDLYKLILPTGDMTNLAFLGRVLSTCDIVTSFVQAEWLAGLLAGKFEYPNLQARERFSAKLGPEFRASPWQLMLVVCLKCSVAEEVSGLAPQICPDDNVHISGDTVCPLVF